MSEEESKPESSLMSALYDVVETDTPIPESRPVRSRSLTDLIKEGGMGDSKPEPEPEPEPEPKPEVGQRQVDLKPAQAQPAPVQPAPAVHQPMLQPVQPQPAPPDPEAGLLPEQKERLRLARIAEQVYREDPSGSPAEYNGLYDKYLAHYKEEAVYVQKNLETGESLEWDDGYKALQEKAPKISDTMLRKLEREDIKREMSRDLNQLKRETAVLKNQLHRQATTPRVNKTLKDYQKSNFEASVPDDIKKAILKDKKAFKENNPFEYDAISRTLTATNTLISQFERVNNGLEEYSSAKHGRLADRIETLGQAHKKHAKVKDGKTFVTRSEFAKLTPAQKATCYTWEADDVKKAFIKSSRATISKKLKDISDKVSKYNGAVKRPAPSKEVMPTPKTATPRTAAPSVSESTPEPTKGSLSSMLLD